MNESLRPPLQGRTSMSQIFDEFSRATDWANDLPYYGKIGLCLGLSFVVLSFTKFVVIKRLGEFVKKTEVGWDNDLFNPIANRALTFCLVFCVNLSLAWLTPGTLESTTHIFNIIYIFILTSMISTTIGVVIHPLIGYFQSDEGAGVAVTGRNVFLQGFIQLIVWIAGFFLIMNETTVDLGGIFASFAIFSLIIGFALQQTLGNILNSFMLAMDRPFDVGDRIEVDGIEGKVVSTGILSTKLLTWSEELIIIPNNTLVSSTVVNKARGGGDGIPKRLNLLIDVHVAYDEDPPHVKKVLMEIASKCPYTLTEPAPRTLLTRLGDYSIDFRMYAWISDYSDEWPARDWILQAISDYFNEEDIVIPYPVNIEMKSQPTRGKTELRIRRKEARQHAARLQMARADEIHREERETVRAEIAWLEQQLLDTSLRARDKDNIRAEIAALASTLDMFDAE